MQISFNNNQIYKAVNFNGLKFGSVDQQIDFLDKYGIDNLVKLEDAFNKVKGSDVKFDYREQEGENSTFTHQINGKTIKAAGKSYCEALKSYVAQYNGELRKMGLIGGNKSAKERFPGNKTGA